MTTSERSAMQFENYDERVPEGLKKAHETEGGLPGFLGIRIADYWPGGIRFEVQVRDELLTPFGNMHGGVLSGLVDHALGTVCYPVIPRGAWAATTEFKLNLLAPVKDGTLSAVAQIISLTKRTAVVRIEVTNSDRLVCVAQGTVLIMLPKGGAGS